MSLLLNTGFPCSPFRRFTSICNNPVSGMSEIVSSIKQTLFTGISNGGEDDSLVLLKIVGGEGPPSFVFEYCVDSLFPFLSLFQQAHQRVDHEELGFPQHILGSHI